MSDLHYDLCVIGGGINGAGIARDAAGRGLSVLLVEADDLGGATSSASSKLIHGGLRYLEHGAFGMVRESLKEREVLLRNVPHLIYPIECVFLQDEAQRPQWLIRIGLWLYDHLGGKKSLPNSRVMRFCDDVYGKPLLDDVLDGIVYSDCYVDDTRLVILNAVDAAARNAKVLTHTRCEGLTVRDGRWRVTLRDSLSDEKLDVSASMVVNATGPWVGKFLESVGIGNRDADLPMVRLVKGSHIILPRQYEGDHAYVLQQPDKRIVFVTPYQGKYTLVGTTEEEFDGDPRDVRISDEEMAYLCEAVNCAFSKTVLPSDVLFTFSGVRPLFDDGEEDSSEVTRGYRIYHHSRFDPPFLSVFGGKLTTYRALSEGVVNQLMGLSGCVAEGWTARESLTGGDFGGHSFDVYMHLKRQQYPWLPVELLQRYVRSYGARMDYFLHGADSLSDLGMHYGDQVFKVEIDYLVSYEWAATVEDIIWRRSKLGLHISDETVRNIEAALAS
ncbi:MAG: glycerol-3-phosphate dehydrogenase [Zetaproteobacteria bacterium]|nr:MAG: glycerol-3-phosphate dehydrogenase [Zetaproteobacteria bacterium]